MRSVDFAVVALGATLIASLPAGAQDSRATDHSARAPSSSDAREVVCIVMPAPTGSRVPEGKVCHTPVEWAEIHLHGAYLAQMYDRHESSVNPSGGHGH